MSILSILTPINLFEEKKKFFSDPSYNPQFIYEENIPTDKLDDYGIPSKKYIKLAQKIVDQAFSNNSENDLDEQNGRKLNQEEVTKKIKLFLKMHGLEKRFGIIWSSSFVARTSINSTTIKLRLPVSFREDDLLGMLYHEIGTHAIRRINYEQQPWFRKKKKYGFSSYLKTEEGLAILHALLPLKNKIAYSSALRYLAVCKAQESGFVEVYQFLSQYIKDPDRCWTATFRQKRGLSDTSEVGGYTKDLVYFEGMVDMWSYLNKNDFDINDIYFGKMSYEDIDKALEMNPEFKPLLPSFYVTNKKKYKEEMKKIGKVNLLEQF
ncbi:MAG: flavohemoglobin expression-modulating QEGLA motif protein [Candidatus Pacebacteria bacterium]|nr:flavohemoglobin expression-modulating QEGLA motif protein [Candidatus Paceibacterota bacterium]